MVSNSLGGTSPILEWSLLQLYQSTQDAVANSTSVMALYDPAWKIVVRMHSGLVEAVR